MYASKSYILPTIIVMTICAPHKTIVMKKFTTINQIPSPSPLKKAPLNNCLKKPMINAIAAKYHSMVTTNIIPRFIIFSLL